jgi:hypothetical protein
MTSQTSKVDFTAVGWGSVEWTPLAAHPWVLFHFTAVGSSWINQIETWFGIITRQAIRRGTFRSVKDLTAAIGAFIDAYNDRCEPFAWTRDADELFSKIKPSRA